MPGLRNTFYKRDGRKVRYRLAIWLGVSCIAAIAIFGAYRHDAHAQMSFDDSFVPIAADDLKRLRAIKAIAPLLSSSTQIRTSIYSIGSTNIRIVRFETSSCRDQCITAFFLNSLSDDSLSAFALLPAVTARSDVGVALCDTCENTWPLVFKADNGPFTSVIFWSGKLVFVASRS